MALDTPPLENQAPRRAFDLLSARFLIPKLE